MEESTIELLSIKEFAERAGVTPSAVYQQTETRLKDYVVSDPDGKKRIKEAALGLFFPEKKEERAKVTSADKELIFILRNELKEKNEQLKAQQELLDRTRQDNKELVERLTTLLDQQQKLTADIQARLTQKETEEEQPEEAEKTTEKKERRHFWNSLFS